MGFNFVDLLKDHATSGFSLNLDVDPLIEWTQVGRSSTPGPAAVGTASSDAEP
jgi:hypothetical protein